MKLCRFPAIWENQATCRTVESELFRNESRNFTNHGKLQLSHLVKARIWVFFSEFD